MQFGRIPPPPFLSFPKGICFCLCPQGRSPFPHSPGPKARHSERREARPGPLAVEEPRRSPPAQTARPFLPTKPAAAPLTPEPRTTHATQPSHRRNPPRRPHRHPRRRPPQLRPQIRKNPLQHPGSHRPLRPRHRHRHRRRPRHRPSRRRRHPHPPPPSYDCLSSKSSLCSCSPTTSPSAEAAT